MPFSRSAPGTRNVASDRVDGHRCARAVRCASACSVQSKRFEEYFLLGRLPNHPMEERFVALAKARAFTLKCAFKNWIAPPQLPSSALVNLLKRDPADRIPFTVTHAHTHAAGSPSVAS
jgi:hypothetical protein